MFLSVFNILLSFSATLLNSLILVALLKESSLHPPSKMLLCSLSATDLCVGLVAQPVAVSQWLSAVYEQRDICRISLMSSFMVGYSLSKQRGQTSKRTVVATVITDLRFIFGIFSFPYGAAI